MAKQGAKQLCTKCDRASIPGLYDGCGKCQFHWDEGVWGTGWAARCNPDHPEAKIYTPSRSEKTNGK